MIRSVKIENYKIHKNLRLELGNLTVLTGINSSGKSSVLQALLLLRQSYLQGTLNEGLMLNGDLLAVGLGKDALFQDAEDDHISFNVQTDNGGFTWTWKADDLSLNKDFLTLFGYPMEDNWKDCSLFTNNFQYISAARQEPSESYPLNTNMVELRKQLSQRFGKCDLVAHYLHYYGVEKKLQVNKDLLHSEGEYTDLLSQVSAWEQVISPDVKVIPSKGEKNYSLKYAYQIKGDTTPAYSATNVGYGLSYALPLVVALLSAEKGSLILVENPEAHLHESAQSELGILIARAAQAGVQVLVETHSNHILNGILVASKRFESGHSGIDRNLVRIYYMKRHEGGSYSDKEDIKIEGDGKIDHQPNGFFNRQDTDMAYLLGF
jgi:predicted ATPase